ncbi:hypothetical protein PMZ80_007179 [Knufia obscura]|uniref:Uncharacterized protein n=1 Tax=Knufia obscura TaxID=1635080 RepID=A0ABR0RK98_9EURO|nr:hypothetical protein PMZ80_007179 [Knufia obscura]
MDPQRPKKSRSLGVDPIVSRQPTSTTSACKTPAKHNSVPSVARRRQSDTKRTSEVSQAPDRTKRSSKASSRDDPPKRSSTNIADSQSSERHSASSLSLKSSIKVRTDDPLHFAIDKLTFSQSVDKEELPLLTFAVVGNTSVGKSVFIRNALDLRRPSASSIASSKVSLGGVLYRLQLIETPRESVSFVHGKILWPSNPDSGATTNVDGVLCLYDVSDRASLEGLPQILAALDEAGTATCLVSCKADTPLCNHEVGTTFLQKVKSKFPSVVFEESSIESTDTPKRCLLMILKEALNSIAKESQLPDRARQDSNAATIFPPRTSSRNPSASSSRSRSNSRQRPMPSKSRENLLTAPPSPVAESEDEEASGDSSTDEAKSPARSPPKTPLRVNTANVKPRNQVNQPQTPISGTAAPETRLGSPSQRTAPAVPATPESMLGAATLRRGSADSQAYRTFLNMDDESIYEGASPMQETTEKLRKVTTEDDAPSEGVTFAELVDRLLAMPSSKGDQKFVPAFLCLYRAFATPLRLLMAIVERFVKTEKSDMVTFTKTAELLRYLSVVGMWTTYYPGDFADSKTREAAKTFVAEIEKTKNYAAAARQIANNLQTFVPDDDEDWAFTGVASAARSRSNTTSNKASATTTPSKATRARQQQVRRSKDEDSSGSDDDAETPSSPRHSATPSSSSSLLKGSQVSSQTSDNLHNLETARESARKLRAIPHNPVSKIQWHQFMSCTTEELAHEITRIDSIMYSAIRPRDFVRYVTMSHSQRARPGHIDHIRMMTKHFNHLALFVSGMILLRDKPKHRARMLEKFMDLAQKLRQMNNYHALGAVVAGLNSSEIVRLTQTQELIPQEQHKKFLSLKILMSHQKSHAAYRMAWENSNAERIPLLPRIQEDLIKAATGNPTFVGGQIKWSKFEVMGESIIGVQRSQERPYVFQDRTARGYDIAKLILETKVVEDEDCVDPHEELHERSQVVEPPITGAEKKKFDWLRR